MDACFCFQLHQPYRIRRYRIFDIGSEQSYFDDVTNRQILTRVADRCYLPALGVLQRLVDRAGARFALGISGVLLEQIADDRPDVLRALQRLVATGGIELVSETSHHSLAALADPDELARQVRAHNATLKRLFGVAPRAFRNTELIVDDALLARVARMGFGVVLVEGADQVLHGRSPDHVYLAKASSKLRLLPRHYRLSDDVAFRFTDRSWGGWPLTAEKYAAWIAAAAAAGDVVNIFMDFETFGEHHDAASGVLDFLVALPAALDRLNVRLVTPSEAAKRKPAAALSFPTATSWADTERDTSAWLGNIIQRAAHERLYRLRKAVDASGKKGLAADWRRLTTSDHFYYMSTKWRADGDVHTYFNPHASPYDAYISFMNIARDLEQRVATSRSTAKSGVKGRPQKATVKGDGKRRRQKATAKNDGQKRRQDTATPKRPTAKRPPAKRPPAKRPPAKRPPARRPASQ